MPIASSRDDHDPIDEVRAEFLQDLDGADHLNLSDWECEFVENMLGHMTFTSRQRECIDRMRYKYRSRL